MNLATATSLEYASKFEPIATPQRMSLVPMQPLQLQNSQPGPNAVLRCPLPQITSSPDSLRQFYNGGYVPQTRLIPANSLTNQ